MLDRRTFLITCGSVVAAPAFARFGVLAANGLPAPMATTLETPVLRIDGWESPIESGSDVWVQVNSSWRATWR